MASQDEYVGSTRMKDTPVTAPYDEKVRVTTPHLSFLVGVYVQPLVLDVSPSVERRRLTESLVRKTPRVQVLLRRRTLHFSYLSTTLRNTCVDPEVQVKQMWFSRSSGVEWNHNVRHRLTSSFVVEFLTSADTPGGGTWMSPLVHKPWYVRR